MALEFIESKKPVNIDRKTFDLVLTDSPSTKAIFLPKSKDYLFKEGMSIAGLEEVFRHRGFLSERIVYHETTRGVKVRFFREGLFLPTVKVEISGRPNDVAYMVGHLKVGLVHSRKYSLG